MSQRSGIRCSDKSETDQLSRARWGRIAGVATCAAVCLGLNIPTPTIAAPFSNGNFESPGTPSSYVTVPDIGLGGTHPSTFITNWNVTNGNVNYGQGGGATACQTAAGHCLDLNGSMPGAIEQTFDTEPGARCRVSFYMARHAIRSSATMAVLVNNAPVTGSPYSHSIPLTPAQWQQHAFAFTAGAGTSTTLAFQSTTTTENVGTGPQLDNVAVECISPPPQGRLKVCKVAGPFVAVGTPFTFQAGTSALFTVLAGPAPGGTCSLGPTFDVGSPVWVTETASGMTVSDITVAPRPRLIGTPNLSGGTVQVMIGSGVTDVTFTNTRQTGFIEICKTFTPRNRGGGSYSFTVNPGNLGPFVVPAGSCSPAIEVPAGMVTITEALSPGIQLVACSTLPSTQQGACVLAAGTSTVNVVPGDVSTQTIAIFSNALVWTSETFPWVPLDVRP